MCFWFIFLFINFDKDHSEHRVKINLPFKKEFVKLCSALQIPLISYQYRKFYAHFVFHFYQYKSDRVIYSSSNFNSVNAIVTHQYFSFFLLFSTFIYKLLLHTDMNKKTIISVCVHKISSKSFIQIRNTHNQIQW